MAPITIPLRGFWQRRVGDQPIDSVLVPGSYPPVGVCTLVRSFDLPNDPPGDGARWFLCTGGVLSSAQFAINGHISGRAGPYVPYRFELPGAHLQPHNEIRATIRDIPDGFGPTPGRKYEAGLHREIWIERRPATFIERVHLQYQLAEDYTSVDCTVDVTLNGADTPPLEFTLRERDTGRTVFHARTQNPQIRFQLIAPRLLSPQSPALYELQVGTPEGDTVVEPTGFRRFEARGSDFYLNGRRTILAGVCRHEFNEQEGYAPAEASIRHELARIRHAGFNFVRLVHSPQSELVPRIAAEIGLLVSEEAGLCFHDLADEKIIAPALDVLHRLVLRDRNCPAVVSWLIYNECLPNTEYAIRAAQRIRALDASRLIGMADCSGRHEAVRAMVAAAHLDFYGINIYDFNPGPYIQRMKLFPDKPFLLTEWGGGWVQNNPRVLKFLCDMFVTHTAATAPERTAGGCFWAWADYEERSRGDLLTSRDGFTVEGLVAASGEDKPELALLSRMCFDFDHPAPRLPAPIEILAEARRPAAELWRPVDLDTVVGDQSALEAAIDAKRICNDRSRIDFRHRRPAFGHLTVSGIPFVARASTTATTASWPLLIGRQRPTLTIPVNATVAHLAILGHVALVGGYPGNFTASVHHGVGEPVREFGAPASRYDFVFDDGTESLDLKHGVQMLRGNDIARWFMTRPRAPETIPAVRATLHPTFEILRFDLWQKTFTTPRRLHEIRWTLTDPDSIQALLALSIQTPTPKA